jgi:hypothetical protein
MFLIDTVTLSELRKRERDLMAVKWFASGEFRLAMTRGVIGSPGPAAFAASREIAAPGIFAESGADLGLPSKAH